MAYAKTQKEAKERVKKKRYLRSKGVFVKADISTSSLNKAMTLAKNIRGK